MWRRDSGTYIKKTSEIVLWAGEECEEEYR